MVGFDVKLFAIGQHEKETIMSESGVEKKLSEYT